MPSFYEFFAGGGMARAGLGSGWSCLLANDVDPVKAAAYEANWGSGEFRLADVRELSCADLPGRADLAWASFPCQDLSLAGPGAGLAGARSGTFHPFWRLIRGLAAEGRAPGVVVLENVCGALTSHGGRDFGAIASLFGEAGYQLGALVIDAALFTPQSRPRLFLIGTSLAIDPALLAPAPTPPFHTPGLQRAAERRPGLLWWRLPAPARRNRGLADILEETPAGVAWHSPAETRRLVSLMSGPSLARLDVARHAGRRVVGALYRRTRPDGKGGRRQRAEARFDDLAGCLRTPAGGSSRQVILVVEGETFRSRLISPRETARLMGLADDYVLPARYNIAYHLTGDGVVVDVVRHLANHLLEPLLAPGARAAA
ncbi:MAG TPA: DNA cytosine methyltransferase [Caulobacteraceae bacterium]|jgi:DNA (cytosine-5)-methyltransferase 1|nr:DNA cytosine methyltransferase [Caulobacteraceae bacterium]